MSEEKSLIEQAKEALLYSLISDTINDPLNRADAYYRLWSTQQPPFDWRATGAPLEQAQVHENLPDPSQYAD